ncbi:MAG: ABC transporter permease [Nitrososphaerota archaeon]
MINQRSLLGTVLFATKRSASIKVGMAIVLFFVAVSLASFIYMPYNPLLSVGPDFAPPSAKYWFGTTNIGQDVFSQWMYGSRATLLVGFLASTISVAIGLSVGLIAGYVKRADNPLMRLTDVILTLPALPLLIAIAAFVKPSVLLIALLIALLAWGGKARVVRSMVISLKESPSVEIARMSGVPNRKILFSDILKHIFPLVLTYALLTVVSAILTAAGLYFIGVGPVTSYSWGAVISIANSSGAIFAGAWWWFIVPGFSIAIFATGIALIAYGLETAFRATGVS